MPSLLRQIHGDGLTRLPPLHIRFSPFFLKIWRRRAAPEMLLFPRLAAIHGGWRRLLVELVEAA